MDFEWLVPRIFKDIREKKYINPCCVGGDEILNELKSDIAVEMKTDESSITIYQEDWGWALEFSKEKVDYLLAVTNSSEAESDETHFSAYTEATRQEKSLIFAKNVEAKDELGNFFRIVSNRLKKTDLNK